MTLVSWALSSGWPSGDLDLDFFTGEYLSYEGDPDLFRVLGDTDLFLPFSKKYKRWVLLIFSGLKISGFPAASSEKNPWLSDFYMQLFPDYLWLQGTYFTLKCWAQRGSKILENIWFAEKVHLNHGWNLVHSSQSKIPWLSLTLNKIPWLSRRKFFPWFSLMLGTLKSVLSSFWHTRVVYHHPASMSMIICIQLWPAPVPLYNQSPFYYEERMTTAFVWISYDNYNH